MFVERYRIEESLFLSGAYALQFILSILAFVNNPYKLLLEEEYEQLKDHYPLKYLKPYQEEVEACEKNLKVCI